ncbi:MAG: DUF3089 domain-containing protein [Halioglobus sp.]
MQSIYRFSLACLFASTLSACSDSRDRPTTPGPYADDALWLCKPGIANDRCLELDQTTTWIQEDGSQVVYEHEVAVEPPFDCFYVYPTVDLREEPGNMLDLSDDTLMLRPLYNQVARFTSLCNVFAPKYKQMTIGAFAADNAQEYFDIAYADVDEAFGQYLDDNPERNFVLIGHSQGSFMLGELLTQRIDNDERLRERMVSALIVGAYGALDNPPAYDNISLCTRAGDTGCIVAFNSIAAGTVTEDAGRSPGEGEVWPCVMPSDLGGNRGIAANTIYNMDEGIPFPAGVETDWIAYPKFYKAVCEPQGQLGISAREGRVPPIPVEVIQFVLGGTLHLADYNFAMGDLLRIVEAQAANM